MKSLEKLCREFAGQRNIALRSEEQGLYGKDSQLELAYSREGNKERLAVVEGQKSECKILVSPGARVLSLSITMDQLANYLDRLTNDQGSLTGQVRNSFEQRSLVICQSPTFFLSETFTDFTYRDIKELFNSFYG
ncbi:hypothetical protein HZC32_02210 [Candidatus Woesearchaeota archaeon]|nr:hypothetical protein [Candidatus Woesearchaeota archaeon]